MSGNLRVRLLLQRPLHPLPPLRQNLRPLVHLSLHQEIGVRSVSKTRFKAGRFAVQLLVERAAGTAARAGLEVQPIAARDPSSRVIRSVLQTPTQAVLSLTKTMEIMSQIILRTHPLIVLRFVARASLEDKKIRELQL